MKKKALIIIGVVSVIAIIGYTGTETLFKEGS